METFKLHQSIWNYLSNYVLENKLEISAKILHDQTYYRCKTKFQEAPSQIIIRAIADVIATFKTIKSNKQELEKAPEKKNLSIRLDKRIYVLKDNSIKLTTSGKQVRCTFNPFPKFQELRNKYRICDPLIFVKNNEVWLAVSFDNETNRLPDNYCIGVDLGIKRTATTSEGILIVDKIYLKQRRKVRYLKRQLNSKKKENVHAGKKGNSARKHLKKIRHYERNLSKNYINNVVNKVLQTEANTIVIEDLSKIKSKDKGSSFNNRQSQVPYYMFRQILNYKAQALGKRVETVNPAYTSKDDCRDIERGIRKGCRYYASDGKVLDSDINASINIAKRYVEYYNKHNQKKLPISFIKPIDGLCGLNGQGAINHPIVLCP